MTFRYENQFPVSIQNISDFIDKYGLVISSHEVLNRGIENTSIMIQAGQKRYVLRVYRLDKKNVEDIQLEVAFMAYLAENDLPIPYVVSNSTGAFVTELIIDNLPWQAIVMTYITGDHAREYSPKLIANMALKQAKMHILGANYQSPHLPTSQLTSLRDTQFIQRINILQIENSDLRGFLKRAGDFYLDLNLNMQLGYSQFDYGVGNLLVGDDEVLAILDFDDMMYAPLIVCLGYALGYIANNTNSTKLLPEYLVSYESVRPISTEERNQLPNIILFKHYVTNCINVLSGRTSDTEVQRMLDLEKALLDFKLVNS